MEDRNDHFRKYYLICKILALFWWSQQHNFWLSSVFLCPQEQPGLHAHETVADEGEQVHPGPEQLPFWQRAWDHPFLLQPQAAHQGRWAYVPALSCSHQNTIVLWVTCRRLPMPSLGHPGVTHSCPSGQNPVGSWEDEQWHPKTADLDSPHWPTDSRPVKKASCILSNTNRLKVAEVFIILFYFILFMAYDHFMTSQTVWWTSFHWFLSWLPLALTTQAKRKVQHCNIWRWVVPFLVKCWTFFPGVHIMKT